MPLRDKVRQRRASTTSRIATSCGDGRREQQVEFDVERKLKYPDEIAERRCA